MWPHCPDSVGAARGGWQRGECGTLPGALPPTALPNRGDGGGSSSRKEVEGRAANGTPRLSLDPRADEEYLSTVAGLSLQVKESDLCGLE